MRGQLRPFLIQIQNKSLQRYMHISFVNKREKVECISYVVFFTRERERERERESSKCNTISCTEFSHYFELPLKYFGIFKSNQKETSRRHEFSSYSNSLACCQFPILSREIILVVLKDPFSLYDFYCKYMIVLSIRSD